jgi:hypothetical protein
VGQDNTSGYLGEKDQVQHLWRRCWNVGELHSKTGVPGQGGSGFDRAGQPVSVILFDCEHFIHHTPLASLKNWIKDRFTVKYMKIILTFQFLTWSLL